MKQTNIPLNSVCIHTEKTKTSNRFHCLIYKNGYFCKYIIGSPNDTKQLIAASYLNFRCP